MIAAVLLLLLQTRVAAAPTQILYIKHCESKDTVLFLVKAIMVRSTRMFTAVIQCSGDDSSLRRHLFNRSHGIYLLMVIRLKL